MTIVLLHAFPLDERMWAPQVEALEGQGVVAPNLYRLGASMDEWGEAVLASVDGSLVVAGASMGGYCALAIARRAPERLTGLLLAGARVEADSDERRASRADTIELVRTKGARGLWEDMRPKLFPEDAAPDVVEGAREIVLDQEPDDLVRAIGAIRDRPDARAVLASLKVPVVVAVGEHDPFLPVEEAPPGQLHVFDVVGHLPSLERPAEFNRLLLDLAR